MTSGDDATGTDERGVAPDSKSEPQSVPSETDRKIFLGCLAAVLASRYDYDIENDVVPSNSNSSSDDDSTNANEDSRRKRGIRRARKNFNRSSSSSLSSSTSGKERIQLQKMRHRKRRYEFLSEALMSAGTLLQLSNSNAGECYIPVLHRLMRPSSQQQYPLGDGRSENGESTSASKRQFNPNIRVEVLHAMLSEIDNLRSFVEDLTPGSGIRCLAMFLMGHLLHCPNGYDARIRHCIKTLGILLIIKDCTNEYLDDQMSISVVKFATLKFEAMERMIARKLFELSLAESGKDQNELQANKDANRGGKAFVKGMKIGGAAIAAGVLFAMTAGMAAPAIAAGVAAVAGGTAITATAAALLTTHAAVTTIFGVGGGSLAAYKMKRRVSGLTEFEINKENAIPQQQQGKNDLEGWNSPKSATGDEQNPANVPELFINVCISGWLQDNKDFQRPWGVTPTKPPITERLELMERFYSIHNPEKIKKASSKRMQKEYKDDKWADLCHHLEHLYGRDPEHLFPLENGMRSLAALTEGELFALESLFTALGCSHIHLNSVEPHGTDKSMVLSKAIGSKQCPTQVVETDRANVLQSDPTTSQYQGEPNGLVRQRSNSSEDLEALAADNMPKHLTTVWDYQTTYGGEIYTVRWESKLIKRITDSIAALGSKLALQQGATEIMKHTILSTLMVALAVPAMLATATTLIDGPWTLAVERADEAGKELARSLMTNIAGNRPVTLLGFSFGARVVYSCLKELAIYQQKWEDGRIEEMHVSERKPDAKIKDSNNSSESVEMVREPASIVEDAILLGLPDRLDLSAWDTCRQVVAGRLVHGFSQKDWVLSLTYQVKQVGLKPVCGTCPINIPGIENFDLTDLLAGHQDYVYKIGPILDRINHGSPFRYSAPRNAEVSAHIPELVE